MKPPLIPASLAPARQRPTLRSRARTRSSARSSLLSSSAGFTLIEVLIALIVLVLGVLGAAAMTLTALRDSKQSSLRGQATALAYELADVIRMSRDQETVFTGNTPAQVSGCWTGGCTPTQMAQNNFYEWKAKLQGTSNNGGLPGAQYLVCRDASNVTGTDTSAAAQAAAFAAACDGLATSPLVIKIKWDEKVDYARGQTTGAVATTPAYLVVLTNSAY